MKIRKPSSGKRVSKDDGHLMGSTVLGERGQLVIPKDIRERLKLKSGAKLMVMHHSDGPIVIFPLEKMQYMLTEMTRQFTEATRS